MKAFPLVVTVLAVLAVLLAGTLPASAQPISARVSGPPALAPNQAAAYNLTVLGMTEGVPVNYSISYWITGDNVTGGAPLAASPGRADGTRTTFKVNVTAPPLEQTMTLVATVQAVSRSGTETATVEFPIVVVTGIVLSATFHNASPTAALNVTVRFYVDGTPVGTTTIKRIDANADQTARYTYLPLSLPVGSHTVRAEADLDHNGIIDASKGEVVVSDLFYRETPGLSPGWTFLLGLAVFVPVFLGVVAVRRRRQA